MHKKYNSVGCKFKINIIGSTVHLAPVGEPYSFSFRDLAHWCPLIGGRVYYDTGRPEQVCFVANLPVT